MTAQLANGGYKIYPRITVEKEQETFEDIKNTIEENSKNAKEIKDGLIEASQQILNFTGVKKHEPLYKKKENIKFVLDAMFGSTNEPIGTSYASRMNDPKYQFAGKTGTAQVRRITERARELDLKTMEIPYNERDHALYIGFGPYKNPRYSLSVVVEHGGSGSKTAAPMAKKLFKMIIDRHELREKIRKQPSVKI